MVSASDYRDLMQRERTAITGLCDEWQRLLNDSDEGVPIPDEVSGKIQIAIGQAQLLVRKKFEQYNGLLKDCEDGSGDMPVTVEDLQGFWELVYIQVADIHSKFSELDKLRKNNWEPLPQDSPRKPLGCLNKSGSNGIKHQKSAVVSRDFSAEAKERLAKAKAMIRKRMEEQCCQ